jgi:hypothetical protein
MPLSALFILFDFVVHNPAHPETRQNLILLDIVSGHFSLLEHTSSGALPGNYLSRFGTMARLYTEKFSSQLGNTMRIHESMMVRDDLTSLDSLPNEETEFHKNIQEIEVSTA